MAAVYQDLVDLNLPEWKIGEIVNGRLLVRRLPLPGAAHAFTVLLIELRQVALNGPWWILPRVELCLGDDVLVPDLSGWRRERMPEIPNAPWIELVPDWVCDVIVPSSVSIVRVEKPIGYARHRIGDWWVLDAENEAVETNVLNGGAYECAATFNGAGILRARPFEELEIELAVVRV
jgi:Uma2 family endonuclease